MPHIILLGDSIFDNGAYVSGGPDVNTQLQDILPAGWKTTLRAVDGSTTAGISAQLVNLPSDATHLVLSVGGNDALSRCWILEALVSSSTEAFLLLAQAIREFEPCYRTAIEACLATGLPLVVCAIYNGNFPDHHYQQCVKIAIATYNDTIIRLAVEKKLTVIDLRFICCNSEDYAIANPIEPSTLGGAKIAAAIRQVIVAHATSRWAGAYVLGAA